MLKLKFTLAQRSRKAENGMQPLTIIYWTRVLFGIAAAVISIFIGSVILDFNLLNSLSIALLVYIVTYYLYKRFFLKKVEKPSSIFSTGVGAYFLSWLVMWVLIYTLLYRQS
jgi:hypothetical protein